MLSVFLQIKKFENKGEMWELKYVALGLREFTALLRYNKEGHRATLKREKPIAIVKPRKQKIIKVRAAPEDVPFIKHKNHDPMAQVVRQHLKYKQ